MAQIRTQRALIDGQDLLRVEIKAPQEGVQARRLDLALVIDRSGSMSGSRLRAAREAAEGILKALSGQEVRLGLVAFNDGVLRSEGWVGLAEARFFWMPWLRRAAPTFFEAGRWASRC